ncbi:GAF domain-containing sensor histidine kinase [Actinomycetospora termitidis]|uniref:GAF domain-containing protein n=1 Tax=Actinomycetospora termitidis TaxID=3053470 RepID=A0ABT7M6A6_9PSEU|nr:histidine kinase [Actinomycetospora sp. Odt1-22]MDL5156202.1 GAF domain-containing protein [Actinomycetospora sp. Odt1-22]
MDPTELTREHAELVGLLDRRAAVRAALDLLRAEGEVAWVAEPADPSSEDLVLAQLVGDRTGLLRGLTVARGHGLTGKVHASATPAWVDDYLGSAEITHTFDRVIDLEGVQRLLAVPVRRDDRLLGVLAVGARSAGTFGGRAAERAEAVAHEVALAVAVAERARLAREVAVHEERSRIAANLHDSVGALLFAIGSGMAGLSEAMGADPELALRLSRLQDQAQEASAALRDSLRTLRASPAALELSVVLQEDCSAFSDRTGVPAELVMLDDPPSLPPSRTDVVIAGVREALLNVEKHASASAVVVSVARRAGSLVVAVTDDGVGPAGTASGLGLTTTSDAVGRLGGTLRVLPDPHGGTTWRLELPC